ncbi:MAG TPA: class I SAM-dependent methyltransferase [Candidatus Brocadiaceae bacterium]|nr:class I SAM-dependent methyltransferase [Candidatus Woesearchaeota archaeon]
MKNESIQNSNRVTLDQVHISGGYTGYFSFFLEAMRNKQVCRLIKDGTSILDLGCGRAEILRLLYASGKKNIKYTGCDITSECIDYNIIRHPEQKFALIDIEKDDLSILGSNYDYIILLAVFEHLSNPCETFKKIADILSTDGTIVLTVPIPQAESIYRIGARLGFFSKRAQSEHSSIRIDKDMLNGLPSCTNLRLNRYQRFLFGFNQLAVYRSPIFSDN